MMDNSSRKNYWNNLSKGYRKTVVSPFMNSETEKVFLDAVDRIRAPYNKSVQGCPGDALRILDNGCGKGFLLPYLINNSWKNNKGKVHLTGIDFSPDMIKSAGTLCRENNIITELIQADNRSLPFPAGVFDEVVVINSILAAERPERIIAFCEVYRVLKEGGWITGLFPSNENHIEQAYEIKERNIAGGADETDALHKTYEELVERRFDPVGGFIDTNNGNIRIKLYFKFELEDILSGQEFRNVKIEKFHYPENVARQLGLTARNNDIYDWLVSAEKQTEA